jgi:hypothetical protein
MTTTDATSARLRQLALAPPPDDPPMIDPGFTAAVLDRLPRHRAKPSLFGWWIVPAIPASAALAWLIQNPGGMATSPAAPDVLGASEIILATLILAAAGWVILRPGQVQETAT